ncbi:glycine cleavage system H protein, mitochondrial [Contarinia nasturtii]|uniref:glycine cleavage system H protein, mitochondrial n=1 Tax=Contarinia nasturtii TaxID=265458 RepID=UPI0012D4A12D|nr:glycine cleavage system H protein, mitochondrial [Contarinia nasturtii]
MVLCQAIRASSTVGIRAFAKFAKYNASTKFMSNVRHFSASPALFTGRKYTEKHEWVQVNGDIGIVGISNYAQEALGDVVFAQLPDVGTVLTQGDECGALESVKAASEVYTPVSGTVTEKNTEVEDTPSLINSSCYDKGWLFKVKLSKQDEVDTLMNEEKYDEYLKSSSH